MRSGECLSEIAADRRVTIEQIQRWNRLKGDVIHVGQRLVVGAKGAKNRSRRGAKRRGSRPPTYRVVEGDTLFEIADRLGVEVEDILGLNPGLDPDHIEVGQRLVVPVGQRPRFALHSVRRGETLSDIARRYRVSLENLLAWNKGVSPLHLSVRQKIRVRSVDTRRPSQSIGTPWGGSLVGARRLEPHKAYVIHDRGRAWGTEETIAAIKVAFDEVHRRHPRAARVQVRDISLERGGRMDGHRSHRSGRDADITYFRRRCAGVCGLQPVSPRALDVGPQWTLIRSWLRRGQVQYVFIDYSLQRVLYQQARRQGATKSQLDRWFQYPRSQNAPEGIIRHARNHRNHVHVRFVCPRGDQQCR